MAKVVGVEDGRGFVVEGKRSRLIITRRQKPPYRGLGMTLPLPAFKLLQRFDPQMERSMRAFVSLTLRDLGYGFREAFTGSDEQLQTARRA